MWEVTNSAEKLKLHIINTTKEYRSVIVSPRIVYLDHGLIYFICIVLFIFKFNLCF